MITWTVLNDLKEKKLRNKECFFSSIKKEKIGEDGEKSDGHISYEGYLMCEKYLT